MSSLSKITSIQELLEFIRQDARDNGCLSIRGVARLAGVQHTSIIRDGAFASQKLAEKLAIQGFDAGALESDGFIPEAVILVLEYFAYESKAKAESARQLMRTFGTLGLMSALEHLNPTHQPVRHLPHRDMVEYIEAAKTIPTLQVNPQLKQLLEDGLTDELELMRNQNLLGEKKEYTIVKVRAKELGYKESDIQSGISLGKFVAKHIECAFSKRIGDFEVKHYRLF